MCVLMLFDAAVAPAHNPEGFCVLPLVHKRLVYNELACTEMSKAKQGKAGWLSASVEDGSDTNSLSAEWSSGPLAHMCGNRIC
jgi:hypothetical protein